VSIVDFLNKLRRNADSAEPASGREPEKSRRRMETATRTTVPIEFDMMLKGSIYDRPTGRVRQYGITVDGATRVVTSGDYVDRETYDALVKAGAIRPFSSNTPTDDDRKHRRAG
jgi:hypothetical protein